MNHKEFPAVFRLPLLAVTAGIVVATISSCKRVYEDIPLGQQTPLELAFDVKDSAGINANRFLLTTYLECLQNNHNRVSGNYLDAASDDALSSQINISDVERIATGAFSSTNLNGDNLWNRSYTGIRDATVYILNINRVPLAERLPDGRPARPALRSEARWLRAFLYFELLRRYGGIPIIGDTARQLNDDIQLPRSSFGECVNYIVSECDNIKDSLRTKANVNSTSYGRVTRSTAMALKARVLLYAASPLFNGGNIEGSNPLTGYTSYDVNRWKLAADAAKELMDLNEYQLSPDLVETFTTQVAPVGPNQETIFWRQNGANSSVEVTNGPVGYSSAGGAGVTSPTQNLVNAFPMKNGLPITDPASGYDPAHPYDNRDPRLSTTILYNGALWLNRPVQTFENGADRPGGTLQQTRTGYYMRKFMGDFQSTSDGRYGQPFHDFPFFRYTEILLNYAEAMNEFNGPSTDVYDVLHQLRSRAGIDAGADNTYGVPDNLDQAGMRAVLQNERRLELAFEEHRFFDIRRWKIAESVMNAPLNGVVIQRTTTGVESFDYVPVLNPVFRAPQMYLYPIPYTELIKNDNMRQNPGW